MRRWITKTGSIVVTAFLLASLFISLAKSPPTLIEKWYELRDYAISNEIDLYRSPYTQSRFRAPKWITDSIHISRSNKDYVESSPPLIESRDRPWSDDDDKHWSAEVPTQNEDQEAYGFSYSGSWQIYAVNCLDLIKDEANSGNGKAALAHLIEMHSPEFSQWDIYTDPSQIIRQLETQSVIAKRTALLINSGKLHPTSEQFTTLSTQASSWDPVSHWTIYLHGIRDFMANMKDLYYERQSTNRSQAIREVTALISAKLETMKILDRAAGLGSPEWTRTKILESKDQIARELESAKAASPFTRYPLAWENPAAWLVNQAHDIAAYDQWLHDKTLYLTFLAARNHLHTNKSTQTSLDLTDLNLHLDNNAQTTLDQLNASLVTWKWNLGKKAAIKYTSPNGQTAYWPEAPPQ